MDTDINIIRDYPNLYAFSKRKTATVEGKKSQGRFSKVTDLELKTLIQSCEGDSAKIRCVYECIKQQCGSDFEKRCRDRYNIYLAEQRKFTEEEDMIIIQYRMRGISWQIIAGVLNRKFAKAVQNRYTQLTSKKNKAKYFPNQVIPLLPNYYVNYNQKMQTNAAAPMQNADQASTSQETDTILDIAPEISNENAPIQIDKTNFFDEFSDSPNEWLADISFQCC